MCLSSVYKEKALEETDINVIYLNGWVALYNFTTMAFVQLPICYFMGLLPRNVPLNFYQGMQCLVGKDPPSMSLASTGVDLEAFGCSLAPIFISSYLCFNILYNIVLIVVLKYGSANVLWLACTMMVPAGNIAFSLKIVPGHQNLQDSDIFGLILILLGLLVYRFSSFVYLWLHT